MLFFSLLSCEEGNTYKQGKILYENFCENCHMADGTGLEAVIPPLANSDFLQKNQHLLPCMIENGVNGEMVVNGVTFNTEMPGTPQLTEFEITNVINYINTAWGNNYPIQKHLPVREALTKCK